MQMDSAVKEKVHSTLMRVFRGGLGRLAAWLKPGGPVRPWAGLTKMTISKTCSVLFIKSQGKVETG